MKPHFVLAIVLLLPLTAFAGQSHTGQSKTSSQDDSWLTAAHQTNLAEIKTGNLAAERGHITAVRQAGRMLATDHAKLDAKLRPVAHQLGVTLPTRPNAKQRAEMQQMKSKSGTNFDTTWTHDEINGHAKAIEMTKREIQHGSLSKVKQLAQSAWPVLKKHLNTLQQLSTPMSHGTH